MVHLRLLTYLRVLYVRAERFGKKLVLVYCEELFLQRKTILTFLC